MHNVKCKCEQLGISFMLFGENARHAFLPRVWEESKLAIPGTWVMSVTDGLGHWIISVVGTQAIIKVFGHQHQWLVGG